MAALDQLLLCCNGHICKVGKDIQTKTGDRSHSGQFEEFVSLSGVSGTRLQMCTVRVFPMECSLTSLVQENHSAIVCNFGC